MPEKVKCAECGYLGMRHALSGNIVTAGRDLRDNGVIPAKGVASNDLAYDKHPVCFRGVVNFRDADEAGSSPDDAKRRDAVQRKRDCDEFSEWEGLDPRDHYDMIQESVRLQWQGDQADKARRHERRTLRVSVAAVAVAVVALIANTLIVLWKSPQPINVTIQQQPAATTPNTAPSLPQADQPLAP